LALEKEAKLVTKQSRASQFFDQISSSADPSKYLQELVHNRKTENDFLEFKGASRVTDVQVRGFWSEALSGFANTEGGVLIWGIRTDRMQTSSPFIRFVRLT
jgi:Schlafen, AlbA_2